ncbi:hypothetical protein A1Q1_05910 [Trichosporon asahii var. asahii CBS 2479]|uniref:Uncharacterized protein n=1 Tax=Trichosporon asahii var. asahii (strain ATCC 90039 / CBS 2479 / JCM 2466 / KCTC 7840 / NBRC 103889/ NCYC 2677 / UAMH 7654) TaxID=1186058 RepID=J5SI68_TRIAS|nr:hypothetical protein A1Q1_05910 [Trichosporon asahii var. asahii CBS 2479]EJT45761.1 hypothetical protein A1Q1_05910 [Trichosporon asahii var. asahii CBS 2479]
MHAPEANEGEERVVHIRALEVAHEPCDRDDGEVQRATGEGLGIDLELGQAEDGEGLQLRKELAEEVDCEAVLDPHAER